MRRIYLAVSVLILAGAAAVTAQTAPTDTEFGERVDVNLVNVEVYVTDKGGHPVSGLQRGDFTLLEDGKPMAITNFAAVDRSATQPAVRPTAPAAAISATTGTPGAEGSPDPLHLVLFIDNSHITAAHRNRVLRQVREFLSRRLAAGDPVMLVSWDPGLHVRLPFTTDREALAKALDDQEKATTMNRDSSRSFALQQIQQIRDVSLAMQKAEQRGRGGEDEGGPKPTETDTACPPEIAQPARDYAQEARNEVLRSIHGLALLINSLSGFPSRKALLHVSDGLPATPGEDMFEVLYLMCKDATLFGTLVYRGDEAMMDAQSYSVVKQWDEVASQASAQQVTLYTLQATGLENTVNSSVLAGPGEELLRAASVDQIERENRRASLTLLATSTGGRAVLDASDLGSDLARIEDDLGHYYSLGYQPLHTGDGREHKITVKVRRPDVRVRHRQHYRDKPALERAVDHTLASLYYGYQDNPLDIQLEVGDMERAEKDTWAVPFRLRIPLFKITMLPTATSFEGKLRLLVATQAGGKQSPLRQVEVPIKIPRMSALTALGQYYQYEVKLTLEPGEQTVAIAVRDEASTMTSFLARTLKLGAPGSTVPTR